MMSSLCICFELFVSRHSKQCGAVTINVKSSNEWNGVRAQDAISVETAAYSASVMLRWVARYHSSVSNFRGMPDEVWV